MFFTVFIFHRFTVLTKVRVIHMAADELEHMEDIENAVKK